MRCYRCASRTAPGLGNYRICGKDLCSNCFHLVEQGVRHRVWSGADDWYDTVKDENHPSSAELGGSAGETQHHDGTPDGTDA